MATKETVPLSDPRTPTPEDISVFESVDKEIKHEIRKSRHHWNQHEPRMWSRASGLTDEQLLNFNLATDLQLVRSGVVAYGKIFFGKIKIPVINDDQGEGFVHVRVDKTHEKTELYNLFTEEGNRNAEGHPTTWNAIQTADKELDFFVE